MQTNTTTLRTFRGIPAIAFALAALGLSQPAARAELLTNGSFETVTPSPGTSAYAANASTVLDGWTLGAGTSEGLGSIYIANSWAGRSPTDGSVFVCLKFGASLSQTFSSAGGPATLTLNYYNMTQVGVSPHWADLIWSLNGVDIGNTASGAVSTWASASTVVTLLAGSNTLRIRQSPSSKGDVMCLDNVKLEVTASPPPAPTGLAATAGNAQVALTWTASSGAASYNVKRSEISGSGYATIGSPTGTSYTDTTAANGSTYYYVVSATNAVGESANSPEVNATPSLPPPPPAPTGLTATAGNASVPLSWTASSGATSYTVKRSTTSGSGYATLGTPSGTSYIDSTAANGSTYYYVVSASNAGGEGANSSEVSATPAATSSFLVNGSFEIVSPSPATGTSYAANASTVLAGWTLGAGASSEGLGCIYIANYWAGNIHPTDGSIYTCLKYGASLSQTFNAPTSGNYTLTFDYYEADNMFGGTNDATTALQWYMDGSLIANSIGSKVNGWVSQSHTLPLTAGPHTFMLKHNNSSSGDVISLDNVKLVAPVPALAANSTVTASPTTVASDGVTTSTITVTLKGAGNVAAWGKTVTLASSRGATDTISPGSGVSNISGVVTFSVTSTTPGTAVFTATDVTDDNLVIAPSTASVTFSATAVSTANSTVTASPATVTADGTSTATVTVTLKNASNAAVAGQTVTLASSRGASDTISPASGISDASGVVTFTVKSTTLGAPVFTASVTSDSLVVVQTATVNFIAGAVNAANSTVTAMPSSVSADGITTATIAVTLKDANNNPVAGKSVTLARNGNTGGGSPVITTVAGTTSAAGVATFTVACITIGAYDFQATDVTDSNLLITQAATVAFISGWLGNIMPMGDSITDGNSAGGYRDPLYTRLHNRGNTFTFVGSATGNATQTLIDAGQTHHEGHSGYVIAAGGGRLGLDENLVTWIGPGAAAPDKILLMIGSNDIGIGYDMPTAPTRLSTLITHIYDYRPNVKLYVASIIPMTGHEADVQAFNATIPGIVASHQALGQNVVYVPMYEAMNINTDLADGLHPNALGYQHMAQAWDTALVTSPYDAWTNGTFANGTLTDKTPTGDPDGDGLTNQQEFAFGLDPTSGSSVNPITQQLDKTSGTFKYTRRKTSGLTYIYQWSTTLSAPWNDFTPVTNPPATASLNATVEEVTIEVPAAQLENSMLFLRVKAE